MHGRSNIHTFIFIILSLAVHQPGNIDSYAQEFSGLDNRGLITKNTGWRLSESEKQVTLPFHLPPSLDRAEIYTVVQIPDSLKNSKLRLWLTDFRGDLSVSVNGQAVSPSGELLSPAYLDIPRSLLNRKQTIHLSIEIKHTPEERTSPVQQFMEKTVSGVFGGIYFEWLPFIRISNFRYYFDDSILDYQYNIEFKPDDSRQNHAIANLRYTEEVFAPDGRRVFNRSESIEHRGDIIPIARQITLNQPALWYPDAPDRYTVRMKIFSASGLIDQAEYLIGLRKLKTSNGQFYLNDRPMALRGITYRPCEPAATSHRQIRHDMLFIKNAGFNAVRFPHSIPAPLFFNLADSLGLLLFPEMILWRQPESFFTADQNLIKYKFNLRNVAGLLAQHPSMAAIGLGHELPVHLVTVQKFILIAREFLKQQHNLLTYLSPLDARVLPATRLCDFYMVNKYDAAVLDPLSSFIQTSMLRDDLILLGNAGIAPIDSMMYSGSLTELFGYLNSQPEIDGYFIESFRDWIGNTGSPVTFNRQTTEPIYPYGLNTLDSKPRVEADFLRSSLNAKSTLKPKHSDAGKSNVFTLTTFIAGILFFLLYRNNYRLRDNFKRALFHAHGFFVDLRDRRIIALLNSAIVGSFTNLQISVIIAAFFFYFRNDLLVSEALSTVLTPINLSGSFYDLASEPLIMLLCIWALFYFGQVAIAIFLKIFNLFSREHIRFRQSVAVCHWAGAPLVYLLPVSLFSLQIMEMDYLLLPLLGALIFFFFWFNIRLATGIRVLMVIRAYKVFSILILTYCLCVFIFFAFLDSRSDLYEYLILLTRAKNLF